jgi:LacI family transcriptional regulator
MDLHDRRAASEAAGDLLAAERPPTALVSAQNLITVGAVERLRTLGLQRRIALVASTLSCSPPPWSRH